MDIQERTLMAHWTLPAPLPLWKRAWLRFKHVVTTRTWYTLEERLERVFAREIRKEIDDEIIAQLTKLAKEQK